MDLKQLSIGYDLDGGGYEFEAAPDALGPCVAVWTDPDFDYLPIERPRGYYSLSLPMFALAPNSGHFRRHEFPQSFIDSDGDTYRLVSSGVLYGSDRDCHCHGMADVSGAWFYTGNYMDGADPNCERCDGTGYIDSAGGEWALYALADDED